MPTTEASGLPQSSPFASLRVTAILICYGEPQVHVQLCGNRSKGTVASHIVHYRARCVNRVIGGCTVRHSTYV